jgi:hypothetical protein
VRHEFRKGSVSDGLHGSGEYKAANRAGSRRGARRPGAPSLGP